jgi:ABC-type uncharacterized transport system permease subunit
MSGCWLALRLKRASKNITGVIWPRGSALILGWCAILLHIKILSQTVFESNGLNLGFFNTLSFTGCLINIVLLAVAVVRPIENLGIIALPMGALTLNLGLLFPSERIVADPSQWPLELHILIAFLAYSFLSLAAVQALLLAIQDYRLRHRQPGGFLRVIPPLTEMEDLLFQMILTGFILLSITLCSGFFFLHDLFAQHLAHKMALSLIAWLVFAMLLWGRWRFGWRGLTAIRWTLSGFCLLVLSFLGSKLVLEIILQRY